MTDLISAKGLNKKYGAKTVLNNIDLNVSKGEVIGLIGPNGAGKTTLLKAILGLATINGDLEVLGQNPNTSREKLMQRVSFVADTAILPNWIRVKEAIEFMKNIHPKFKPELAYDYLKSTNIDLDAKISQLSKGMVTKAHLSMIMAIDSDLLVLDEPTLGLDIVKRKEFYQQLLCDYFDGDKTIIITTHQVEEIENILTRAIFINDGEIVLNESMQEIESSYYEVLVDNENQSAAESMAPIYRAQNIRGASYMYKSTQPDELAHLGHVSKPSLADLFVAKVTSN